MRYSYNLGKVLLIPKGEYDGSTTYEKLDFVTYNGSSYVAKEETRGNLPTNESYWQLLARGGSVGWDDITGKPDFSEVATSGSYNDLSEKPEIPAYTSDLVNNSGFITLEDVYNAQLEWIEF